MRIWITIVCTSLTFLILAQPKTSDVRERVFIHPNSQVFVVGEALRFSGYTLGHQSGRIVDLSKILYVQLVGKDGPVFEQKLALENGRAAGEFFINSLVPSGRYQLLAYTRWMRNFGDAFQVPITIVNPFETKLETFQDSVLAVKFYLGNDSMLVAGIENQIGFTIRNGERGLYKGRVIDDEGSRVASFRSSTNSSGFFRFTPESGISYQVILEDTLGNFSFHELPEIRQTGFRIEWARSDSMLEIIPKSPDNLTVLLQILLADQIVSTREVVTNQISTFSLASLPEDFVEILLLDKGQVLALSPVDLTPGNSFQLERLKEGYGQRETLNLAMEIPQGAYSISIHKKSTLNEFVVPATQSRLWTAVKDPFAEDRLRPDQDEIALSIPMQELKVPVDLPEFVSLLPENRNELLSGVLKDASGQEMPNAELALSFSGKTPFIETTYTDDEGRFLFHFYPQSRDGEFYLKVLQNEENYQFEVEKKFLTEFPPFSYELPTIDSLWFSEIKSRSIDNQIANAYYQMDSSAGTLSKSAFAQFAEWKFEYALDDYQRFPDFKEYFIEYILGAGIRDDEIIVRDEYYKPDFDNNQLTLLDGVPVSPRQILTLDPYLVERVKVITNRMYLGPSAFDGVLMIETYLGDLAGFEPEGTVKLPYTGVKPSIRVHSDIPTVEDQRPDQRIQLYWNPLVDWEGGPFQIEARTSDVKGEYEIRLEGFSMGRPVSFKSSFQVK